MRRQPHLRPEELDPEQRELYDAIAGGPRAQGPQAFALTDEHGALQGPFGGFLLSPALGNALQQIGVAVRYQSRLTDRVRELAILLVAAAEKSTFERKAHEAVARISGIAEEEIAAVREGKVPELSDERERAAVRFASTLVAGDVDDTTWRACVPPLNERDVFELVTLVGYYSALALQMRVLRVDERVDEAER